MRRHFLTQSLMLCGAAVAASLAAQPAMAFPERPVKLIVAFAPGSSTDIVARLLAEQVQASIGQPVVVENRPGAGGNIATQAMLAAAADGHTLLFHSVAVAVNPTMFASPGYAVAELAPVAMAAVTPNLLYVHPDVKAANLAELLALARTEKLSYASSGNGTTTHLGAEWLFRSLAKVDVTHVPFQPAAATNAVVSGQVPIASTSMPPAVPFAKSGKVRPLAVMSSRRSPALPDVPTVAELGHPGFEANTWFALFAPGRTADAVLERLNAEFNKALSAKVVQERFAALSLEAQPMSRAGLRSYVEAEAAKWGRLVRDIGIKPQ
ncbi:MAG: tripartite tricarboxylate transporter substrate binding protein [Rubrivivax sp.]|nr:tripartite tricarboxylate transporter substrate binding protein [Rubrivivax sp.]